MTRLLRGSLLSVFAASFAGVAGFFLLLPVMPRYAAEVGAGEVTAGAVNGALLLTTVVSELLTPRLAARLGSRFVFAAGLVLLGVPVLALLDPPRPELIVLASAVRGIGFGLLVVLGSTLVALLAPDGRQGEGLGLFGLVIGIPAVIGMPFGVFVAERVGFPPVLATAAVVTLAGLVAVPGLPARERAPAQDRSSAEPGRDQTSTAPGRDRVPTPPTGDRAPTPPTGDPTPTPPTGDPAPTPPTGDRAQTPPTLDRASPGIDQGGILPVLRSARLAGPALVFGTTALAAGVIATFLPLAVAGAGGVVALALLLQSGVSMLTRWWAGWYADRAEPGRLVPPALAVACAGILALALVDRPVMVVAGAACFGIGFGVCQNAALLLMFRRVPRTGYGAVSALWNVAYDAGMGLGAAGFGVLASAAGYPLGFALLAGVMAATLPLAWRDRRPPG